MIHVGMKISAGDLFFFLGVKEVKIKARQMEFNESLIAIKCLGRFRCQEEIKTKQQQKLQHFNCFLNETSIKSATTKA